MDAFLVMLATLGWVVVSGIALMIILAFVSGILHLREKHEEFKRNQYISLPHDLTIYEGHSSDD